VVWRIVGDLLQVVESSFRNFDQAAGEYKIERTLDICRHRHDSPIQTLSDTIAGALMEPLQSSSNAAAAW